MKETLTASVLLIGDELLSGSIQDINLAHIAKTLEKQGIRVRETRIVPDLEHEIVDAVNHLRKKYDYVFTTGGIGPTHDDITSDSIAKAFEVKNVIQQSVFDLFKSYLDAKGLEFTEEAQRMAYAPEGAEIIETGGSAIPGYRVENVFVMAGVPRIMQAMLDASLDRLETGAAILSSSVYANVREGEIAKALNDIQSAHPDVDIGSYPQDPASSKVNYSVVMVVRGINQSEIDVVREKIQQACHDGGYDSVLADDA